MLLFFWFFIFYLFSHLNVVKCNDDKGLTLQNFIPNNYNKEIRPFTNRSEPVFVHFSVYVVDINSINVEDMDFRIDMFVRQKWTEPRLHITNEMFEEGDDYVTLSSEFLDYLWQPIPYFFNSKVVQIASFTRKYSSVTVYRNKTISYTARLHGLIACQMEFKNYPMDIQICPLYIESFSYNIKKVRYRWDQPTVTLDPELKLLQYHIGYPLRTDESSNYMLEKSENFSRLIAYFRFERHIGHHLIQTFVPSAVLVILTWFSFYLSLDAIPGRVTLLVTCLLTLFTMFSGLKSDIPPVAYVKALDVWMAGCMAFVFAALSEFVVVKVLELKYKAEQDELKELLPLKIPKNIGNGLHKPNWEININNSLPPAPSLKRKRNAWCLELSWLDNKTGKKKILWEEIDRASRIVFPILFVVFLMLYWPILLTKSSQPI